jgi:hypothetical protein
LQAVLDQLGKDLRLPAALACHTEEVVETGRLDLRFGDGQYWDVIVELKLYASYGLRQLDRYLDALKPVEHAYLVAITRDVPLYGEAHLADDRWLGSARWRDLLPALRRLGLQHPALDSQWPLFLDVLESEGSMGFTNPDPDLFRAWAMVRRSAKHAEEFLKALQMPLLEALSAAVEGTPLGQVDFYRAKKGAGRPVISKSWNGIIDLPFRVGGRLSVRAGVFAYNPPTRFYVAPHYGRRLSARRARLPAQARVEVEQLIEGDFREYDLHAFLELDDAQLASPSLEGDVVRWAHDRFSELARTTLLEAQHELAAKTQPTDEEAVEELPS